MDFRKCFVPSCQNTNLNSRKIFIALPKNEKIRKAWCLAAGRVNILSSISGGIYCCEDHFNMEQDCDNWMQFRMTNCKLRMKKNVVPHTNLDRIEVCKEVEEHQQDLLEPCAPKKRESEVEKPTQQEHKSVQVNMKSVRDEGVQVEWQTKQSKSIGGNTMLMTTSVATSPFKMFRERLATQTSILVMDIKVEKDIDIKNEASLVTNSGNLLNEIRNSNIDVKIEKDSADLNKLATQTSILAMDIKVEKDIDIKNEASLVTNSANLLNEIRNSNIDVKIETDSADLNTVSSPYIKDVDSLDKHNKTWPMKEDPDSTNNFKNNEKSNEASAVYIKEEIEDDVMDEDSAKEDNRDSTDNNKSEEEYNNRKAAKYKTRTEFKYRVTYTPRQRIELEKEFVLQKFITPQRKSQLAHELDLSERQVKIWFQNRRSKERKHKKRGKVEEQQTEQIIDVNPQITTSTDLKPQITNIDQIKSYIWRVQQLQQSVLSRFLANGHHQTEK